MPDLATLKKYLCGQISSEKKKREKAGFAFVCMCDSTTKLKFQIETRKIERSIAKKLVLLVLTCLMYGIVFRQYL